MKGIAVQTIMLLLIGVLVVGIVVFLVHRYASSQIISETECQSRLTEICMLCKNRNPTWDPTWPNRGVWYDDELFKIIDDCKTYSKFSKFVVCGNNCHCSTLQDPCKILAIK